MPFYGWDGGFPMAKFTGFFPSCKAVDYYFNKWRQDGTLLKLNIGLNMARRIKAAGIQIAHWYVLIVN
jgi:hypothetical protein